LHDLGSGGPLRTRPDGEWTTSAHYPWAAKTEAVAVGVLNKRLPKAFLEAIEGMVNGDLLYFSFGDHPPRRHCLIATRVRYRRFASAPPSRQLDGKIRTLPTGWKDSRVRQRSQCPCNRHSVCWIGDP